MIEKIIELIIFDVDGTFYPFNQDIKNLHTKLQLETVKELMPDIDEATYLNIYKKVNSHSRTYVKLGLDYEESLRVYHAIDYAQFLNKDQKLIDLLNFIRYEKNICETILSTAPYDCVAKILGQLEVDINLFEFIVTSDTEGVKPKPDLSGFKKIIELSKVQPNNILMAGDREEIDIVPAKELGMKTARVYYEGKESVADYVFKDIYAIKELINKI